MDRLDFLELSKNPIYSDVLLELSPNMVLFLDPENNVCKMSKATYPYFCPDGAFDPIGRNIYSLVKNSILTLFMKKWEEKLNKGSDIDETFPLDLEQNDQYEWFQIRGKLVEHEGRLIGKVFFISNITELYSHKKILDTLMSSFPGYVIVFDRTLRTLLVSDSVARTNGYHSWRDVVGRPLSDLPKLDVLYIESLLDRIILTDEPIHEVYKQPQSSGEFRWFYIDIRIIKSTAGVFGYIMTQFDITEEVKPKAILEALMESSSDAIVIVNPGRIVEYASKMMVRALGIQDWRLAIGKPWTHLFSPNRNPGGFSELVPGGAEEPHQGTITVETGEGKKHFNYRVNSLDYQNQHLGTISIATNITELVAARDRAESAVRAKAAFFANMSHELRTPINAVLGMNELLSRTQLSPLQRNYSSYVRSSATILLSTINDILDFSRMEDWKLGLTCAPYNTIGLLQDVIKQVVLKTAEKELSFTVDLDPSIPSLLIGDELRVRQILINLLNNAVKFTGQGEINLTVSMLNESKHNSVTLAFRVRDTGIGIPKNRQAELFDRFTRIENGKGSSVEGSGLGLSICKGLVALMDGSLSVESEEGAGSIFTARIMQGIAPGAEPIARFAAFPTASVLVLEEDAPTLASIKGMCANALVKIVSCTTTDQFSVLLSDERFAWTHVIFEYHLGYQKVLSTSPRHPTVKWLALLSMTDFIGTGKDPSIDFLFKPLMISAFARFIRGEHVDFSSTILLSNGLSGSQPFFRANGVTVLVVDDNPVNRKVAEGFLQALDIHVEEAESGLEAIEKAGKVSYDLILLDHLMPGLDGIETSVRLRSLAGCQKTPIIALTANTGNDYSAKYHEAGMNDVLQKPINFDEFVVCLKKWLPLSKLMDAPVSGETETSLVATAIAPGDGLSAAWIPGLDRESGISFTGSIKNLEAILKVFYRTAPKMLEQLESGRRSGNSLQFRTATHTLISSCANIGGVNMSAMARDLEQAIIGGKNAMIDRLYTDVHSELEKIISGVSEYLANKSGESPEFLGEK